MYSRRTLTYQIILESMRYWQLHAKNPEQMFSCSLDDHEHDTKW